MSTEKVRVYVVFIMINVKISHVMKFFKFNGIYSTEELARGVAIEISKDLKEESMVFVCFHYLDDSYTYPITENSIIERSVFACTNDRVIRNNRGIIEKL